MTYETKYTAPMVRMVGGHQQDSTSLRVAYQQIAQQLNLGRETLPNWVPQAEIDFEDHRGVTTVEADPIQRFQAENKR